MSCISLYLMSGDLSGWGGGDDEEEAHETPAKPPYPEWLVDHDTLVLIGGNVVLLLWAAGGVLGAIRGDYTLMQLVTPVMLAYAGYIFGKPFFGGRNGNGKR